MSELLRDPTFLSSANSAFLADLFARWAANPGSVDASWQEVFAAFGDDPHSIISGTNGASWAPHKALIAEGADDTAAPAQPKARADAMGQSPQTDDVRQAANDSIRALMLVRAYRVRGHLHADLDPLGLAPKADHSELDPFSPHYGFSVNDLDRQIYIAGVLGRQTATLREIVDTLTATYCGSIGVEFMHIQDPTEKAWIQERIEQGRNHTTFTPEGKRAILERLTAAECFEHFLQKKYTGTKRFGLEGGEATIPAIEQILKRGGQLGLQDVVLGMPHRGRLNILANVLNKPFVAIFSEFQGNTSTPDDVQGSGDVKYHLGTSADRDFDGNVIHLSLTANPSHLEAVNAVVLGKVRAKQVRRSTSSPANDDARREVLALLLHGDAAFAGQGLVHETLMMSDLIGYRTGGTIHVIVNNQIGFTTTPKYSRSGPYCSDIAKSIQAPIFHVNGDDPEAVVHAARLATEYRQRFLRDVVVDIVCYRRHGHNEGDEPAFTQPVMYRAIAAHPTTRTIYAHQLVNEGLLTQADTELIVSDFMARMDAEFAATSTFRPNKADWLEGKWQGLSQAPQRYNRGETGIDPPVLGEVGQAIARIPNEITVNPKIIRQLQAKQAMMAGTEPVDWATAEALAFGSLLVEGVHVRLSGQDVGRGTFSQRHAILYDQETETRWIPLCNIREQQGQFEVYDSPLSEAGVLGFEYGCSLADPHSLVLWEAQFGDFANGAQVIIDQFISSGESKWLRMSGLVMLLPHGYEGQGPEHSSARLERYLQLCSEHNWQVAYCSTPANYFHILRRQMRRDFRKPLIVLTPKSLLRHKQCTSALPDFLTHSGFHRVLPDVTAQVDGDMVRRVILCSGKVYYDLVQEVANRGIEDIAIIRLEQIYPFPHSPLGKEISRYPKADIIWCQEEPENMGAWFFVDRRIEQVLGNAGRLGVRPRYVGRQGSASTATGLLKQHNLQQARLLDEALTVS